MKPIIIEGKEVKLGDTLYGMYQGYESGDEITVIGGTVGFLESSSSLSRIPEAEGVVSQTVQINSVEPRCTVSYSNSEHREYKLDTLSFTKKGAIEKALAVTNEKYSKQIGVLSTLLRTLS